nr:long-chain fatty acid transport protein 1-like [Leptinotarsa decemlineata]
MVCWIYEKGCQVWILPTFLFLFWFLYTNRRLIYILYKTLPRDLKAVYRGARGVYTLMWMRINKDTVPKIFTRVAKKHPNKVALYYEDEAWTFQQLEDFSNKVANYFIACGYKKGDNVALLLDNRPEYPGIWLGLSKAGIVTALLNTNLKSGPLHHSISAADCRAIIFGSDFVDAIEGIKSKLDGFEFFHFPTSETCNTVAGAIDLKNQIRNQSVASPSEHISQTDTNDTIILMYTSGTTGLPKAARVTHSRYIMATTGVNVLPNLNKNDIFYNPLPLYHGNGGIVGVGQSLCFGITVVIRKKFSASNFWTDCKKYKCTVGNYIGEICRYLLLTHRNGKTVEHGVKKMIGNGLRKEIWVDFMNTFNIPEIYEFYGATEGNASLSEYTWSHQSLMGKAETFLEEITQEVAGIPVHNNSDEETPVELKPEDFAIDNFVFVTYNGQKYPGKIVGLSEDGPTVGCMEKRLKFWRWPEKQECLTYDWVDNGTMCVIFRWKGENVATTEVETVASEIIGAKDVVVYGVEVPGSEGKAGMIAIADPEGNLDVEALAKGLKSHLPAYAVPMFLRILDSLPVTGTFKVKKMELQKDGFDLETIRDALYFLDAKKGVYIPLEHVYENIISQKLKL